MASGPGFRLLSVLNAFHIPTTTRTGGFISTSSPNSKNPVRPYRGQKSLAVTVGGLRRRLPVVSIADGTWIASDAGLVLGDATFIQRCAELLARRLSKVPIDVVLTSEAKSIPLAFALTSQLRKERFVVARKSAKGYMKGVIVERVRSITTKTDQKLVLPVEEARLLKGRRVCILDDVVSTGDTIKAMARLVERADGTVTAKCAIWREGPWYTQGGLIHLGVLPIFRRA